jgi:hypothetical protein
VREFCPEIFTLAYMVKSIGIAGFDSVTENLATKYKLFYVMTPTGKMHVYKEGEGDADADEFTSSARLQDETYYATMNSIALAKILLKEYPYLQTQFTADFLTFIETYGVLIPDTSALALTPLQVSAMVMEGGGDVGDKENETKSLLALAAIQNYEIYYSLAIKAAYQDRKVTESEFQEALKLQTKSDGVVRTPLKTPKSIAKSRSRYTPASAHAAEMALESPLQKGSFLQPLNF